MIADEVMVGELGTTLLVRRSADVGDGVAVSRRLLSRFVDAHA
jgi:hypothetical protein